MANKVYFAPETVRTWRDSAGNEVITLASLAAGAGRVGESADLSAILGASRSRWFWWRFFCRFNTTPVVGETVPVYAKLGDGTNFDNDEGQTDAALSSTDKLNNLMLLDTLVVDEAATGVTMSVGGLVLISDTEFAPVIHNNTADALSSTAADNGFDLRPVPDEIQ